MCHRSWGRRGNPDPNRKSLPITSLHLLSRPLAFLPWRSCVPPWCPDWPLQPSPPCSPARKFVSGLTLTSPHCVSGTVIHGRVFRGHRVQLQEELPWMYLHLREMTMWLLRDGWYALLALLPIHPICSSPFS